MKRDIIELLHGLGWILEADLAHLEQRLLLGLDTVQKRRVRELELVVLSSLESVVRLCLRNLLDEVFQVTAVTAELEAVEMEHIRNDVVEKPGIVRDNDCSDPVSISNACDVEKTYWMCNGQDR